MSSNIIPFRFRSAQKLEKTAEKYIESLSLKDKKLRDYVFEQLEMKETLFVKRLLERGMNPNIKNNFGQPLIFIALNLEDDFEFLNYLLFFKPKLDVYLNGESMHLNEYILHFFVTPNLENWEETHESFNDKLMSCFFMLNTLIEAGLYRDKKIEGKKMIERLNDLDILPDIKQILAKLLLFPKWKELTENNHL